MEIYLDKVRKTKYYNAYRIYMFTMIYSATESTTTITMIYDRVQVLILNFILS